MARASSDSIDEFVVRAVRSDDDACLLWPFATFKSSGYGQVMLGAHRGGGELRPVGAHVHVCTLAHGMAPAEGLEVAHSCGNRLCVNARHLRWDTRLNNHADKRVHGTMAKGEAIGNSRLKDHQVREIMKLKGAIGQRKIASRFGVTKSTVARIHRGETWSHIMSEELA